MKRINKDGTFNYFQIFKDCYSLVGILLLFFVISMEIIVGVAYFTNINGASFGLFFYFIAWFILLFAIIQLNIFLTINKYILVYSKKDLKKTKEKLSKKNLKRLHVNFNSLLKYY